MTHVLNDPAAFDEDALAGFSRLHADLVRPVQGGVVRRHPGSPGKVAVLYGGGSGHSPVFFGLVGPGPADGAVVGNLFTSPSGAADAAASPAQEAGAGAGTLLERAGAVWAGGTSAVLWGSALRAAGAVLGDEVPPGGAEVAEAAQALALTLARLGKANLGDKTMCDAAVPAAEALATAYAEGQDLPAGRARAADAARAAAEAPADLVPKVGRARPHANRSVGTPDPGARSLALVLAAAGREGSPP